MISRRTVSSTIVVILASACSIDRGGDEAPHPHEGRVQQAILGGTVSDDSQNATIMLVHQKPGERTRGICTASLVAPRLVLTARHCVASADENVACDADGTPLVGGQISGNYEAADLFVFVGRDRPNLDPTSWKPSGQGLEILDDASKTLCDHDLAFLLLKEPILDAPIASLRIHRDVSVGEKLLTVGWGVASAEIEPSARQQRSGVTVKRVGPNESIPVLATSEFLFDESICLGDSGGPIFDQTTKAVVGVVSRGGNGVDERTGGPAATCVGADNVGTKLSSFEELVTTAFVRANATPSLEPAPEDSGCSTSPPRPSLPARTNLGLVALVGMAVLRRRREHRLSQ